MIIVLYIFYLWWSFGLILRFFVKFFVMISLFDYVIVKLVLFILFLGDNLSEVVMFYVKWFWIWKGYYFNYNFIVLE